MRKNRSSTAIVLFCLLLSACGAKNAQEEPWRGIAPGMEDLSAVTDRTEYYDLAVESEPLFGQEPGVASTTVRTGYRHLGTQFIMGEPVQLMAAVSLNEADIYLRRKDGDSELVLQDVPNSLVSSFPAGQWYLDREGSFYCIRKSFYTSSGEGSNSYTRQDAFIAKLLPSGEILYETPLPADTDIEDICQPEDGSIELLWTYSDGSGSFLERLRMEKVDKIPLVCRGSISADSWLGERIARFNRENSDYHIVLEDCGINNDIQDFARLTSIQMGAGKGPDILYGNFMEDYMSGMLEKGALEELSPWLEASGIHEEDYIPTTFATWRQGDQIYSVNYWVPVQYYLMSEKVLGSRETPDIETLADALLSWKGEGVWQKGLNSGQVLNWFLEGSDSLWGMVDWESGSCNFYTPLFGKLLEAARRYGDDGRKNLESGICERVPLWNLFFFKWQEEREAAGQVLCGTLFDDGCYASSLSSLTMAINANSSHKEGAWEFISLLIGEESQSTGMDTLRQPVHINAFEEWLQEKLIYELTTKRVKNGADYTPAYYGEDTSEEKLAEYRQTIREARPLPLRTRPILTIILEEAEDYFNGSKSGDEITKIINNRVQLYLDEGK